MRNVFGDRVLEGRVAFVTGGGSGIGLRIAQRMVEHGAKLAIAGRRSEKLVSAAEDMRRSGGRVETHALDVRDYDSVQTALEQTRAVLGEIDVLVCAAAGNFPATVLGMSANGFRSVVEIDLLGTLHTCRAAHPHLRKPGASIINISATHAFTPMAGQAHVCAAKSGVDMLTKVLALEWGPDGVRVNCVSPGPVDDTEGMRRLAPTPEARDRLAQAVPLRRFATKHEIADLVLFLCSDAAAYITGAVYVCDGGLSLTVHNLGI